MAERRLAIKPTSDFCRRLSAWVDATQLIDVPVGPLPVESIRKAGNLVARLPFGLDAGFASELETDPDFPSVLHALVGLLHTRSRDSSSWTLREISGAYGLVSGISWEDDFGERDDLLARLAFLGWDHCRQFRTHREAEEWRRRCVDRCAAQTHVRQFLALAPGDRPGGLAHRYLSDRTVLLAACDRLERERNRSPKQVEEEGLALYEWLSSEGARSATGDELVQYFLAYVAMRITISLQYVGDDRRWREWFARAKAHADRATGAAHLMELLEFARLSYLHRKREHRLVLTSIGQVIERFEELGMPDKALNARFLRGISLKELGHFVDALNCLSEVRKRAIDRADDLVLALTLSESSQIHGELGDAEEAQRLAVDALPISVRSGCSWAVAQVQGTLAELLRNESRFDLSARGYRASASLYEGSGMAGMGAYVRVVLAETLLLAGRHDESAAEIVMALPTIERENLTCEAVAAVAILQVAVRHHQSDPDALRQLREQLQLMREQGRL